MEAAHSGSQGTGRTFAAAGTSGFHHCSPTSVGPKRMHGRPTRLRFGREFGSTTSVAESCSGPSPEAALKTREARR